MLPWEGSTGKLQPLRSSSSIPHFRDTPFECAGYSESAEIISNGMEARMVWLNEAEWLKLKPQATAPPHDPTNQRIYKMLLPSHHQGCFSHIVFASILGTASLY